jgi:RHS repeat-associated protein
MAGNLGYQSGWTDPATSDVNMDSRWYNPAAGQFLSRDAASNSPIPDSVSANTFAYGNDNPLTQYDLFGTCSGFFCAVGNFFSAVGTTVHNAVTTVGNAIGTAASDFGQGFQNFMSQARQRLTQLVTSVVHTATTIAHTVVDAYHAVNNAINASCNGSSGLLAAGCSVYHATTTAVAATYHAVKYAVNTATQYVQHHAAAIVSFVASTAVFMGCEAAVTAVTGGTLALPGVVGCSAAAGAVGSAVTYAMTTPVSKWSVGGFATQALTGAATGAAAGFLGGLGGELLGPVMDAIGSRLGPAVVDDAADTAADAADSGLDSAASDAGAGPSTGSDTGPSTGSDAGPSTQGDPAESSGDPAQTCQVNSFTGATRVLLANGGRVAIDKLKRGQKVVATDPYTRLTRARRITRVIRHTGVHAMVAITLVGGATLQATDHHPFWDATTHRFAYASQLRAGDQLREPDGQLIRISRTRDYQADLTAYNLTISGIHTYYVLAGHSPVLVHNSCLNSENLAPDTGGGGGGGAPESAPSGGEQETLYRTMKEGHFNTLERTGKMPGTGETMTSPTEWFSQQYEGVLVKFTMKPGTTQALEDIGVRDTTALTAELYPDMPLVTETRGWNQTSALFKAEGGDTPQINIGLGKGTALDLFNSSIQSWERIR